LPTFLDPGTKGGVIVLGVLLFIAPFLVYNILTSTGTLNEEDAGRFIGVGFTIFTSLLWVSTYIFRVATKDMTYVSFHSQRSQKGSVLLNIGLIVSLYYHGVFSGEAA